MVLLVPFDGSDLSKAALRRANEFSEFTGEEVVALTVIPHDGECVREWGWIGADEAFDADRIADRMEAQVHEIAPDATFRAEVSEESLSLTATVTMDVVRTIRDVAHELDASILFIGSENAGRIAAPVTSVGDPIARDPQYDVYIVRHVE